MQGVLQSKALWQLPAIIVTAAAASGQPQSQFTAAEQVELARIHTAGLEHGAAFRVTSNAIQHSGTEVTRPAFYQTMLAGVEAAWDCHQASRHFFNAAPERDPFAVEPTFDGVPRAEVVSRAVGYVANCHAKTTAFADQMKATGQAALANPSSDPQSDAYAQALIARADRLLNPQVISLGAFNSTLPYTNWQPWMPGEPPNVIGPHGEYEFFQRYFSHSIVKWLELLKGATVWYGEAGLINARFTTGYREMQAYGGDAYVLLTADKFLFAGIRQQGTGPNSGKLLRFPDYDAVDKDFAFSTGLRPRSFWERMRGIELINSPSPHEHGLNDRALAAGITGQFAVVTDQMGEMTAGFIEANLPPEHPVRVLFDLGGGQSQFANLTAMKGRAREFYVDLAQGWLNLDGSNQGIMGFFRPPLPPPGGCEPGQTCQPPDPPPPQCPVLVARNFTITPEGQAAAQCVEQP